MTECLADQPTARLAYLLSGDVEITPIPDPDTDCDVCGADAVLRVYGDPDPSWRFHTPFTYAECCVDCGAWCVATAVNQRSAVSGAIRVEVAANVWAARDDA